MRWEGMINPVVGDGLMTVMIQDKDTDTASAALNSFAVVTTVLEAEAISV